VLQPADQQIFLIDEDEAVRDSLKVLLESHGIRAQDFRSGADFLARTKALGDGCLVLGFNRHIVSGLDLVSTLRRRGISLPVIFIVGGGDASTKAAALASGASAYLERPVEEAALIRAIKATLAQQHNHRANSHPESTVAAEAAPARP
jgi:FixJ family two-component response regulator